MKITELKKKALECCSGNWGILVGITILFMLICIAMAISAPIGGLVITPCVLLLSYFIYVNCLMLKRNNKTGVKIREVNITLGVIWNYIKYSLCLLLIITPGILLVVLPSYFMGDKIAYDSLLKESSNFETKLYSLFLFIAIIYLIWIKLSYIFTIYVIIENNKCNSTLKLMKEARILIKGNIKKYILLKLSFIGWGIVSKITFSIGSLWLLPYMELTTIEFYYNLKENKKLKEIKENNM